MIKGIDVSAYQLAIDYARAGPAVGFAIVKLGGGEATQPFVDPRYKRNVEGFFRYCPVDAYWFFSGRNSNEDQLRVLRLGLLLSTVKPRMLWIDIEDTTRDDPKNPATWVDPTEIDRGLAFADEVERVTGIPTGIYTGAWWWNERWPRSLASRLRAVGKPLWVASYLAKPDIPLGWDDWDVWQVSDTGSIPGIPVAVDINYIKEPTVTRGQPRIDYGRAVHVLPADATLDQFKKVADVAYASDKQTIGFSYDDAGVGDLSSRKAILWNIPASKQPEFTAFYAQYYPGVVVEFRFTDPVVVVPPVGSTGKTRLGVNIVTGDGGAANRALAGRCNALSIINNFALGSGLAENLNLTIMLRRYVSGGIPPADPDLLFEGAGSPYAVYLTPLNECDVTCYGTPQEIAARAAWDAEMWRKMKAKGRKYAGGGFSMGTPDFTRADICDAMRQFYAPLYHDGMAMNFHLYSPRLPHTPDIWYELRWRFLFEKCGFNPDPNLAGIYCDETGLDEGGVGGFPAHGASASDVGAWCRRFLDASQADGYGNLLRAAVIFQCGNNTDWAGYNVDNPETLAQIGAAAQAPVTRQIARPRAPAYGPAPVIAPSPRKRIAQWEN